ncbi:MAG: diacylglycerol kinase family protein [Actinomycetes bacterium]
MTGVLIANPRATTTHHRAPETVAVPLTDELKFDVAWTRYRGHATQLASEAAREGVDVVVVLGGDGTVNEVVNGLLHRGPGPSVPHVAVIPGGSTNVFARAAGVPRDQEAAASQIAQALRRGRRRVVGLGRLDDRWFTFTAGLGLDAEVVAAVEARRAAGRRSTPGLYLRSSAVQYFTRTDRRHPALTLHRPGHDPEPGLFAALIGNTSPWTFLRHRRVDPFPGATFDTGLDLLALRSLRLGTTVRTARQLLTDNGRVPSGRGVVHHHDQARFTLVTDRPIAAQVDGDWVGLREAVTVTSVPQALSVVV